jgi:hypothetical protein
VTSDQSWLSANPATGNGDDTVGLLAEANPTTNIREAILTVAANRVSSHTIIVIQAPRLSLSVLSDSLMIGASEGSTVLLGIASNTSWTAASNQTWLQLDPSSGNGDTTLMISIESNHSITERIAIITVSGEGVVSQTVVVIQESEVPTGVPEAEPKPIKVYPNPVDHFLYIDDASGNEIKIYNSQGQIVFSQNIESNHENADLSQLSSGIYLIKIADRTWKIFK